MFAEPLIINLPKSGWSDTAIISPSESKTATSLIVKPPTFDGITAIISTKLGLSGFIVIEPISVL